MIRLTPTARRRLLVAVGAVAAVVGLGLIGGGRSDRPTVTGTWPTGFDRVTVVLDGDGGTARTLCVWLARTPEQRRTGLSRVTTVGPADGMLFDLDPGTATAFTMRDTLIPLDLDTFGVTGDRTARTAMTPCARGADCTRYPVPAGTRWGLETPAGTLTPPAGARLTVGGPCLR